MRAQITQMTVEEFERFVNLPENADKLFEYVGGEVVEVPSNPYASKIAGIIFGELYIFLKGSQAGHLTGEAGGYWVSGERYAPDVGFISTERQPALAQEGYNPNPPDLAVEVDFPSTYKSQEDLRIKVANYLAAGTVVWIVRPETKIVEVYTPGQAVRKVSVDGALDGGNLLPGFRLAVKDIFPD
jgi:Uma2 family endonuclease